jgi:homoserine dehydrogenase
VPGPVTRKLCLLGFGNVGRRFCELVARTSGELARDHGLRVVFTAVGTGSHGSLLARDGLTAAEVLAAAAAAGPVGTATAHPGADPATAFPDPTRPAAELVAASGADLLIEATPLDAHGGAAAIAHLEAGLTHGMDAITVNKGPIAWDYRRLTELAAAQGRRLLFEGAVMDGCPVFSLFRSCLPDCRLLGFDAVFNSTTNYILDAMGEGYAEADPAHDIDGHDAAAKTVILANVLMGASLTPDDVPTDGIGGVSATRVAAARAAGRRLRVVCSARRGAADGAFAAGNDEAGGESDGDASGGQVHAAVRLTELAPEHPLFAAGGSTLSVLLHTDLMGTLQIAEHAALPEQTAYAIYADLLAIHERR